MDRRTNGRIGGRHETACPQFRLVTERQYPAEGYCVLAQSPAYMIPTVAEHREFCTTSRYPTCVHFERGAAAATSVEAEGLARPA
jgi:hypothetical protein